MTGLRRDKRPDIVAATARMSWKMGGKRELKKLAGHLHEGETVRFIAEGTYEHDQGIVVLTDVRLLFLFHGVTRQRKEDFPLDRISSVQTKSGMVKGEMKVFVVQTPPRSPDHQVRPEPSRQRGRQGMAAQHAAPQLRRRLHLPTTRTGAAEARVTSRRRCADRGRIRGKKQDSARPQ